MFNIDCANVVDVLQTYLLSETPKGLVKYREEELETLRGNGSNEQLEEWDRVYDYAYYNDLADPDKGSDYVRPVLGGSSEYPYPRRGRTSRPPAKSGSFLLDLRSITFCYSSVRCD